jgi:hypothetical protein
MKLLALVILCLVSIPVLAQSKGIQFHLVGAVLQKVPSGGYLVSAYAPTQSDTGVPAGIHKNADGSWSSTAVNDTVDPSGVQWVPRSVIFLNSKADYVQNSKVDILVKSDGEYTFVDTQGASETVGKYLDAPAVVPPPAKNDPQAAFHPGSMNP